MVPFEDHVPAKINIKCSNNVSMLSFWKWITCPTYAITCSNFLLTIYFHAIHLTCCLVNRVQPGECYHLYTSYQEKLLADYQLPEMLRTRLEELCLHIKVLQTDGCFIV